MNRRSGVALAAAGLLAAWVLLSDPAERGDPWPLLGAIGLAGACYAAASHLPPHLTPWVAAIIGTAAVVGVLAGDGVLSDPLGGPLGYANANAALAVQGAAAWAVAGWSGPAWLRLPAGLAVVGAIVVCLQIGAFAALAGALLVLLVMLIAESEVGRRAAVAMCLLALVSASALAFVAGSGIATDQVAQGLTDRRVALWTEGFDALRDDPLTGAGAREFRAVSPTAASDADTREAHSELLQRGAENGLPGLALELAAVVLVAVALIRSRAPAAACALAGWTAVWAHAGIDWVLAFPIVVATAAAVAGLGTASEELDVTERQTPGRQRGHVPR